MKIREWITVLLFGSVNVYVYAPRHAVDPELEPYYYLYEREIVDNCSVLDIHNPLKVHVEFKELPNVLMGLCQPELLGFRIKINKDAWYELNEHGRHELIAHEVAHCILNLDHNSDFGSFMHGSAELGHLHKDEVMRQLKEKISQVCQSSD